MGSEWAQTMTRATMAAKVPCAAHPVVPASSAGRAERWHYAGLQSHRQEFCGKNQEFERCVHQHKLGVVEWQLPESGVRYFGANAKAYKILDR